MASEKSSRRQAVSQTLSVLSNPFGTTTGSVRSIRQTAPVEEEDGQSRVVVVEEKPGEAQKSRKLGKLCLRICSLFLLAVPITMIAVGAVFFKNCPLESRLPIWLIVAGILYILGEVMDVWQWISETKNPKAEPKPKCYDLLHLLLHILQFVWLIVGSVWVYTAYQDMHSTTAPDSDYYCEKTVFWMSFVTVTVGNLAYAALILGIFCLGLCAVYQK